MFERLANWWRQLRCSHATLGSRTWYADDAVHTETQCFECGKRLSPVQLVSDETVLKMLIERAKQV